MPKVPLADKKNEAKLLLCAEDLRRHIKSGNNPTEALHKVALDHNLLPDEIRLLGRLYNTAATRAVQQLGGNLFEKASSVEICDPEAVVSKIYSDLEKPGNKLPAIVEKTAQASAEEEAEQFYKDAAHKAIVIIKRMNDESDLPVHSSVHGDLPPCPMMSSPIKPRIIDDMKSRIARLMELASEPLMDVGDQIASLKPDVRDHVIETIQVIHGPGFKAVIRRSMAGSPHLKRPHLDEIPEGLFDKVNQVASLLSKLSKAKQEVKALEAPVKEKREKEDVKKKAAAMLGAIVNENTDIYGHPSPEAFFQNVLDKVSENLGKNFIKHARKAIIELMREKAEMDEKAYEEQLKMAESERESITKEAIAPPVFPIIPGLIPKQPSVVDAEVPKPKVRPSTLSKIRQIQTESLLQFWKETDDVIKNFTDAEILAAVNELVQTFPDLPMKPAYFRYALRTYLQTGYMPFRMPTYSDRKGLGRKGGEPEESGEKPAK